MAEKLGEIFGAIIVLAIFSPAIIFIIGLTKKIDVDKDGISDI